MMLEKARNNLKNNGIFSSFFFFKIIQNAKETVEIAEGITELYTSVKQVLCL